MGPSFEEIAEKHRQKVQQVLAGQKPVHHIDRVCSIDDGSLLKLPTEYEEKDCQRIVAFTPAAGASSRFLAPFADLLKSLETGEGVEQAYQKLLQQPGVLPDVIHQLKTDEDVQRVAGKIRRLLLGPKALFPCVQEGVHFLQMKSYEHEAYGFLGGQVFVAPDHFAKDFENIESTLPTHVFTQSLELSTVRCTQEAEYVKEAEKLSVVPAGHGALIELFPKVQECFPDCESLLIRNVDNVTGVGPQVVEQTKSFVSFYGKIRRFMQNIRVALTENSEHDAQALANELLSCTPLPWSPSREQKQLLVAQQDNPLVLLQMKLFHTPVKLLQEMSLLELYQRPLNILGQVPRLESDVGGTPVMTKEGVKLCVELAHVTEKDREVYLSKATHFNPVLVMAELTQGVGVYRESHPFWIVAEKKWQGEAVFYYESLLYELLGNSLLTNVIFVSVDRSVFHPHKNFSDTAGRALSDLGF